MLPVNKILRVVFDTNVLAAALRSNRGASFVLISMLPSTKFELAVSVPLYLEYLDVLMRPNVKPSGISNADVLSFVRKILDYSHKQSIYFRWRPWLKDAKDDMILELAIASNADYIVTFNLNDFENIESFGVEAILPSKFLEIVRKL
ncbi:MAG TPA: putative toxin-antitoxin system toxin component, PIN family [Pyrinomonadaceae bacterium]|nr:putative toxin-antitoxin system toxin component, PIN family [Pyrinomonadaceae bacterium]